MKVKKMVYLVEITSRFDWEISNRVVGVFTDEEKAKKEIAKIIDNIDDEFIVDLVAMEINKLENLEQYFE